MKCVTINNFFAPKNVKISLKYSLTRDSFQQFVFCIDALHYDEEFQGKTNLILNFIKVYFVCLIFSTVDIRCVSFSIGLRQSGFFSIFFEQKPVVARVRALTGKYRIV